MAELIEIERRWAVGVCDDEGASPKMKNLIKAPMRITTESWPRRNPWMKESLLKG